MTTQEITAENFTAAMRKVVAERGEDYVYHKPDDFEACQYTHADGTPGCIIGAALAELGYTAENTPDLRMTHPDSTGVRAAPILRGLDAPYNVVEAANDAQSRQDNGFSWGKALEVFEEVVR